MGLPAADAAAGAQRVVAGFSVFFLLRVFSFNFCFDDIFDALESVPYSAREIVGGNVVEALYVYTGSVFACYGMEHAGEEFDGDWSAGIGDFEAVAGLLVGEGFAGGECGEFAEASDIGEIHDAGIDAGTEWFCELVWGSFFCSFVDELEYAYAFGEGTIGEHGSDDGISLEVVAGRGSGIARFPKNVEDFSDEIAAEHVAYFAEGETGGYGANLWGVESFFAAECVAYAVTYIGDEIADDDCYVVDAEGFGGYFETFILLYGG